MSISLLRQLLMKEAVKKSAGSSGIMTINKNIAKDVEKQLQKYINDALAQGVDLDTLSESQLKYIIELNKPKPPKVFSGEEAMEQLNKLFPKKGEVVDMTGKKLDSSKPIMGGTQDDTVSGIMTQVDERMTGINKANKKLGELLREREIMYGKAPKTEKNPKVIEREMFKEANEKFNKTDIVADSVAKITSMEPVAAMKEANKIIKREGIYKNLNETQSKKILKDTEDWIFQRDPDDLYDYNKNRPFRDDPNFDPDDPDFDPEQGFYTGGRAGFANGLHAEKPKINLRKLYERMLKHNDQPTTIDRSILRDLIEAIDRQGGGQFYNVKDDLPKEMEASQGGRAGHYTGGMVDVEPSLSDIGHGSDSLMARTRLMSPGQQATTSTGLNYLLAEDNDNLRIPFSSGSGGGGRRAFLKLLAALTGGIAGIKSGIVGLGGKESGKKAVTETIKQSTGSDTVPPYFFKLVEKIKTMGDDTLASQDKAIAKKYKDYVMEEDFAGNITIIKKDMDNPYPKEVYMNYKVDDVALPNKKGSVKVDEYEEFTARPDFDGKMKDVEGGVPDEVIEEAMEETIKLKADGGRIGFSAGKLALSKLGITGSSRRFLEKVFGKERFEEMIKNDPDMHRGLLEVVEMFRKKDKEGLKMYMQKFLPHMDDVEIEQFIVGTSPDIEGLSGQLIRLGSGRDYKDKLQMIKEADNVRKLDALDVDKMKPNAEGGRIKMMFGNSVLKAIIKKSADKKGISVTEFLKTMNPKSIPPEIKKYMTAADIEALKKGQKDYYQNLAEMMKTRKSFQEQVEGGKKTPASPLFEHMEKMMDKQSYVPKTVSDKDIGQVEQAIKNKFFKNRKDNALGGLQKMLGE